MHVREINLGRLVIETRHNWNPILVLKAKSGKLKFKLILERYVISS